MQFPCCCCFLVLPRCSWEASGSILGMDWAHRYSLIQIMALNCSLPSLSCWRGKTGAGSLSDHQSISLGITRLVLVPALLSSPWAGAEHITSLCFSAPPVPGEGTGMSNFSLIYALWGCSCSGVTWRASCLPCRGTIGSSRCSRWTMLFLFKDGSRSGSSGKEQWI